MAVKLAVDSLDERDGPAAHVLLLGAVAAQVVGKRDVGDDRGQLGTQRRLDPDSLRRVADADVEPAGIDLRRQLELVLPVPERGRDRDAARRAAPRPRAAARPSSLRAAPRLRTARRARRPSCRATAARPRRCSVACRSREPATAARRSWPRSGQAASRPSGTRGPRAHQPAPQPVPRVGHGGPEVAPACVLGHLLDGGLAQGPRPRLLRIAANQLDDAQQLVADLGVLRPSSRASCSRRRCRQIQRWNASGTMAAPTQAATKSSNRTDAGVSHTRSMRNISRNATSRPKMAAATASIILIDQTRRR